MTVDDEPEIIPCDVCGTLCTGPTCGSTECVAKWM